MPSFLNLHNEKIDMKRNTYPGINSMMQSIMKKMSSHSLNGLIPIMINKEFEAA
jgi:hypothetical protein